MPLLAGLALPPSGITGMLAALPASGSGARNHRLTSSICQRYLQLLQIRQLAQILPRVCKQYVAYNKLDVSCSCSVYATRVTIVCRH